MTSANPAAPLLDLFFEPDWYLGRYPDVAQARLSPRQHFVDRGLADGRLPGPWFDAAWYLQTYTDVARSGVPAFAHFVDRGWVEGRYAGAWQPRLMLVRRGREGWDGLAPVARLELLADCLSTCRALGREDPPTRATMDDSLWFAILRGPLPA